MPTYAEVQPDSLSADGEQVTFCSAATNLVPGDHNGQRDCFVRIRSTR